MDPKKRYSEYMTKKDIMNNDEIIFYDMYMDWTWMFFRCMIFEKRFCEKKI